MMAPEIPPFTSFLGIDVLHRSPERSEARTSQKEPKPGRNGSLLQQRDGEIP
jgi:hypothetical protein